MCHSDERLHARRNLRHNQRHNPPDKRFLAAQRLGMTKVKEMIELHIPGREAIQLQYVVFDVNGTLATDGQLIAGLEPLMAQLRDRVEVRLLTADTHGKQIEIDRLLNLTADRMQPSGREREQKADYVRALGAEHVAAIGNGGNDVDMLKAAALGIAVIGHEGAAFEALTAADVVTHDIFDALGLLLNPKRLIATLRR
jgi:soluble P-type ATPase